ncbi:uncharacterized protein METZ01_LOCUS40666 [marine metagenome]|uniref:Bacterial repeat domain-containing protein n=1 Tax=marine metagenome TaxID=408172 RepID=A0A381R805_9ZZZZ
MKKIFTIISVLILFSCEKDETVKYMLTTSADPTEGGIVLPSTRQYNTGDTATLIASPSEGYVFDKWTGATGNAKTTLVIDGDKTVVGNFVRIQFELTVTITGEGTVAQKVIKAGGATKYNSGTIVELTATPKAGWIFKEWSGSLIGTTNPQQITLDKAKSVTATFIEKDKFALTIVNDGQGSVAKKVIKAGTATKYTDGSIIELTATPVSGWQFEKWSGCVSGTDNPVQVTINSNKTAIAVYKNLAPIVLDNDGITMKAKPDTSVGTTYEINGITYTVVDNTMLKSWISTGKDLSTAVTTLVTDMKELFKNNSSFNTNICSWDVSNVTTMEGMFEGASIFNKDISKWDTNKVTNMDKMFKSCTNFNQDLSKWCVVNLSTEPTDFVTGSSCDSDDKKPVWGTWPECPLIGDWELESWTNNTDNVPQFDQGEKKCDNYPSDAVTINGGKEDYGTYKMTTYTCFTDDQIFQPLINIENGVWTYNGTNDQVKVGENEQNLSVYNLSYTKDANYFTVNYTDYDDDSNNSREITEVWKRK